MNIDNLSMTGHEIKTLKKYSQFKQMPKYDAKSILPDHTVILMSNYERNYVPYPISIIDANQIFNEDEIRNKLHGLYNKNLGKYNTSWEVMNNDLQIRIMLLRPSKNALERYVDISGEKHSKIIYQPTGEHSIVGVRIIKSAEYSQIYTMLDQLYHSVLNDYGNVDKHNRYMHAIQDYTNSIVPYIEAYLDR